MSSPSSLFDLTNRRALVTGGAAGIGRSCALALARAGADVAIADLNEDQGARTAEDIRRLGRAAVFVRCDVTHSEQVAAMLEAIVGRFGRLDIALNNAGIFRPGHEDGFALADWERVIAVNLTGTWLCAHAQMRQMSRQTPQGGKIINVGSIGAYRACSNAAYDASKAAVLHLTRSLAASWGRYNINVNSVSPGYVATVFGQHRSPEARQALRQKIPLGYVQRMQDLHGPVLFLASSASDYVTGHDVVVDGGHTLGNWIAPLERSVPPRVSPEEEIEPGCGDRLE